MSNDTKGCADCQTPASKTIDTDTCPDCGIKYKEKSICGHCGHSAFGTFVNDICPECNNTYWKCGNCGRIVHDQAPPAMCPSCHETCDFKNITCYTPDCGGPDNIDPRL